MTERQLEILRHSLGMDKKYAKKELSWWFNNDNHRNHYTIPAIDSPSMDDINILVNMGYMSQGQKAGRDLYFYVTDEGIKVAKASFEKVKK